MSSMAQLIHRFAGIVTPCGVEIVEDAVLSARWSSDRRAARYMIHKAGTVSAGSISAVSTDGPVLIAPRVRLT